MPSKVPKQRPPFKVPYSCRPPYPYPGTMAERILDYIIENPKTTKSQIIKSLNLNPSPVTEYLKKLVTYGMVTDDIDYLGHHHYKAVQSML